MRPKLWNLTHFNMTERKRSARINAAALKVLRDEWKGVRKTTRSMRHIFSVLRAIK